MYHSFQVDRQQGIHETFPIRPSLSLDEIIVLWPQDTFFGLGRAVSLSVFFSAASMVFPPRWSGGLRLARQLWGGGGQVSSTEQAQVGISVLLSCCGAFWNGKVAYGGHGDRAGLRFF
jgi:hypothetical protein